VRERKWGEEEEEEGASAVLGPREGEEALGARSSGALARRTHTRLEVEGRACWWGPHGSEREREWRRLGQLGRLVGRFSRSD
jgi:hypothetical protein